MSALPKKKYTVEEYLQMELTASYKSEYYKGEIFPMGEIEGDSPEAMAGALPPHNKILSNIIFAFHAKLNNKGCDVFGSDQQIFIPETGLYTYPDISVFCGSLIYENSMALKNPLLLVEVLSKVTEGYNRGGKFQMYRSIPTLIEYLIVDSKQVYVELWRKENGTWLLASETWDLNQIITFKSIGNIFLVQEFYHRALEMMEYQQQLLR
ncbi:MAG: Uma2 family endonuclease [Chitinophagaceae bacterium]|nr:Uma2 family endonuclease [Chitinophagaceae bacterium]